MKKMISLQFVCMYQALEKTYSSTQEVLETLSLMDFSIVGMVSNEILVQLKKGNTLEECFLVIHVRSRNIYKEVIQWNSIVFVYQYWHIGCGCLSNHDDANEYVKSVLNGG